MTRLESTRLHLSRGEARFRAFALAAVITAAALLRTFDPAAAHPSLGLSCGAITGVPCIFCGTTRALHHLLNGQISRALYFNWLAFPIAALALAFGVIGALELVSRRRLFRPRAVRVTPRAIGFTIVTLAIVWSFQVWLAVSQHKTELLNPRGALYALLVR